MRIQLLDNSFADLWRRLQLIRAPTFFRPSHEQIRQGHHQPRRTRDAIRGTTALVDGVRLAYAFWYGEEKRAREICRKIGYQFEPNKIVYGGVVKANGAARRILATYARNEFGLIIDNTARLGSASPVREISLPLL